MGWQGSWTPTLLFKKPFCRQRAWLDPPSSPFYKKILKSPLLELRSLMRVASGTPTKEAHFAVQGHAIARRWVRSSRPHNHLRSWSCLFQAAAGRVCTAVWRGEAGHGRGSRAKPRAQNWRRDNRRAMGWGSTARVWCGAGRGGANLEAQAKRM